MKRRKAKGCIKPMPKRNRRHRPRKVICAQRHRIERVVKRLRRVRALATRFKNANPLSCPHQARQSPAVDAFYQSMTSSIVLRLASAGSS